MRHALALLSLFLVLVSGCVGEPVGAERAGIVDGTFGGPEDVVFMYRLDGAACTGTIIAPRVVLTANHCVEGGGGAAPANYFRIYVGNSQRQLTAEYRVSEVRPVPGAGLGGGRANDVALLILSTAATQTPRDISIESPSMLFGNPVTAVGYGQTPTGSSGTKYNTEARIQGYQDGFVFVDPSVCSGDSGGPLIGPEGRIWGVASFIYSPDGRTEPTCGTAPGAYNEIFRHLDFIRGVVEETGTCAPAEEICDGVDNDCDEMLDEGCIPLGDPCERDDACTGGLCRETPSGRVCTSACDPLRPDVGCGLGFYCANGGGCDGFCLPGEPGTSGIDADCESDADCDSLFCADPGDGRKRCLAPCQGDAGLCLAGEVCAAGSGSCGGCVPRELVFGDRGLGEPCELDADCRDTMTCNEVAGIRECASSCTAATGDDADPCAEGFLCREGLCARDRTQGVGGVCTVNADCGPMGICAQQGGRSWCTAPCESTEDCPERFDCVPAGGVNVCAPMAALDGEACTTDLDCASSTCATVRGESICTSFCDARNACAPGFECARASGTNVCVVPAEPIRDDGDCSVGARGGRGWIAWLVVGALALLLRRRRAR